MERADVVHVWADVGVRRVKGRLRPHRGVPLGRYPDEGDVGESRTSRQRRRPVGEAEGSFSEMTLQKKLDIFLYNSASSGSNPATPLRSAQTRDAWAQLPLAAAPHSSSSLRRHFLGSKAAFTAAS